MRALASARAENPGSALARTILYGIPHERGSVLKLGTHLRKPFLVQTRFLTRGLFAARTSENPGRTSTRTRRMFCGRPLCLRSIHKTSASERKRIHIGKGFQPPRERRKKRVDVEIFRPFLAKFRRPCIPQKSRTACSCAYKKLNYRN